MGAWWAIVGNPWLWAVVVVLVVAERRWPARPEQVGRRLGWTHDLGWFLLAPVLALTVVAAELRGLAWVCDRCPVTLGPFVRGHVGAVGTAVVAFVVADLCGWASHRLHHRSRLLWAFHSVHHAPRQLTALSDRREHVVETAVSAAIVFVPARLLGVDAAGATALAVLTLCVGAVVHANVRTDLGPLGWLVVSPQAHRVHHSIETEHHDHNFGVVLMVWDRIFGTALRAPGDYPETGITDPAFPVETSAGPIAVVATWLRQTAYPFRVAGSIVVPPKGRHARRWAG